MKERLLWAGWFLVVIVWVGQPFLPLGERWPVLLSLIEPLVGPLFLLTGVVFIVLGYAGTLWCYESLGDAWRIGINRDEKTPLVTRGPYRYIRHPIYTFQVVMLIGILLLLPTPLSFLMIALHAVCVWGKSHDEEAYLMGVHGQAYQTYQASTGRFLPKP